MPLPDRRFADAPFPDATTEYLRSRIGYLPPRLWVHRLAFASSRATALLAGLSAAASFEAPDGFLRTFAPVPPSSAVPSPRRSPPPPPQASAIPLPARPSQNAPSLPSGAPCAGARLALQPSPADKRPAERSDADSGAPVVSAARFRRAGGSGPAAEWARVVQAERRLAAKQLMCALVNTADSDRVAHVRGLLDVLEEEMRDP